MMFIIGTGRTRADGPANVTVERQVGGHRSGFGDRQRNAENRVGAEARFVRRAIKLDHRRVDFDLVFSIETKQLFADIRVDVIDRLGDALALVGVATIAQLDGLVSASGCAGGNRGPADNAVFQFNIHLNGWIAAAVKNLACVNIDDGCHEVPRNGGDDLAKGSLKAFSPASKTKVVRPPVRLGAV
jgi:hypothetical protein